METGRYVPLQEVIRWNNSQYSLEATGDSLSLIILGEDHFYQSLFPRQAELIRMVRPDVILFEPLAGWSYDPSTGKATKQKGRKFEGLFKGLFSPAPNRYLWENLARVSDELGIPIVGCDLTSRECHDVFKEIMKYSPGKYQYDTFFRRMVTTEDNAKLIAVQVTPEIMALREQKMADLVLAQVRQNRLVVAIIGLDHGVNIHDQKLLSDRGFNYCFVNQMAP